MNNHTFIPTTVLDGFFEDPDDIREYAESLEYFPSDGGWPGSRTGNLFNLNYTLFTNIANKFLALFSDRTPLSYEANIVFQRVGKEFGQGWVHQDTDTLTGIVYLNKPSIGSLNYGTSFYTRNRESEDIMPRISELQDLKTKYNLSKEFDKYKEITLENNAFFRKTIDVSGEYNRLVAFDSNSLHAANIYDNGLKEDRITLAMFFKNIRFDSGDLPVVRANTRLLNY